MHLRKRHRANWCDRPLLYPLQLLPLNKLLRNKGFCFAVDRGLYRWFNKPGDWTDYRWWQLPLRTRVIIASLDICYGYQIEIAFHGVIADTLPDDSNRTWADRWYGDQLYICQGEDRVRVLQELGWKDDASLTLFAFNMESFGEQCGFVMARSFSWCQVQ